MSEADGIAEALDGGMRVAVAAAGQVAQHVMAQRERDQRTLETASDAEATQLRARLAVERQAARTQLAAVHEPAWWDRARPHEVADLYATAKAWEQSDAEIHRAAERMRTEVRDRYGVDVDTVSADPREVAGLLARASGEDLRRKAREDQADIALLSAAERGERALLADTDRDGPVDETLLDALHEKTGVAYDSAERREAAAGELANQGIALSAVQARVRADVSQGQPATSSVQPAKGSARAPRSRVEGAAPKHHSATSPRKWQTSATFGR